MVNKKKKIENGFLIFLPVFSEAYFSAVCLAHKIVLSLYAAELMQPTFQNRKKNAKSLQ